MIEQVQNELRLSEMSIKHMAEIEQKRDAFIKSCIVGGRNRADELQPELDDRSLFIYANQKRLEAQSLLVQNKEWHDIYAASINADLQNSKLKISELKKVKNEREFNPSTNIPTKEDKQEIQNTDHISINREYLKLGLCGILLLLIMVGEIEIISQSMRIFGKSKLLSYVVGTGVIFAMISLYHFGPQWLESIKSKFWRTTLGVCLALIGTAVLVGTAEFRDTYRTITAQSNHVDKNWFALFSGLLSLATFFILQVPVRECLKRIEQKRKSKNSPSPRKEPEEITLDDIKQQLEDEINERDRLEKLVAEIELVARTCEWKISTSIYQEGIAQLKFSYLETRGAIPESFAYMAPLDLQLYFKHNIISNESSNPK